MPGEPSTSRRVTSPPARPTAGELEILDVLWLRGPSTVAEIREHLEQSHPVGYTTVLKMLQIMTEKGLVERDSRPRRHIYRPSRPREETQLDLVDDLLDRAFGGSAGKLVMRALSARRAKAGELAEIRRLLDRLEQETP